MIQWFNSDLFSWVILPGLIFLARICDVTIGTIRIIFVSKAQKLWASLFGFFEVLIWLLAIGQIMQNLNNVFCFIAYAAGFAFGNYIGITIEEKLAMGTLVIRVFTGDGSKLIESLRESGFGVTNVPAQGSTGRINIIFTVIKRASLPEVVSIIKEFNPRAFYSIEELRSVNAGVFPAQNGKIGFINSLRNSLNR